jgi:hypothetical protein
VMLMKGPAYVADAYEMEAWPFGPGQRTNTKEP